MTTRNALSSRVSNDWRSRFVLPVISALLALALPLSAQAEVIAYDMVGSTSDNLISYTNPWTGAFGSAGDGFQKYQRGVSPSIPFSVLDDSLAIFPGDSLGIIKDGNTDVFFGIVDTENPQNSGPVTATWVFDIAGASDLGLHALVECAAVDQSGEWVFRR